MADFYGIAGAALILFGWAVELLQIIRRKKSQVPLSFALLSGAGSALLTWHAIVLNDMAFIVLNACATFAALINIAFNLMQKGK
ncbi:MAG: lipid-A-disaccharide synthase N-terminal domain-containing protein [Candidatus Micrarchaeota archaeon]|nr:lipid-A-disaccharide synthase N-terminal domain-containing protein [Candidatus Micrarchaeota archaeon]